MDKIHRIATKIANVTGPKRCTECRGTGFGPNLGNCIYCNGSGYTGVPVKNNETGITESSMYECEMCGKWHGSDDRHCLDCEAQLLLDA